MPTTALNNVERSCKQPENKYYYPGGTIGGPVLIPWTQLQQEPQQAVLLHRVRVFLPGARHRAAARDGSHRGDDQRRFLARRGRRKKATSRLPANLQGRSIRRYFRVATIPASAGCTTDRPQHAGADEAVPGAECGSERDRRIQLRAGRNLQSEQHRQWMYASRLQHQRQHEGVRPLQLQREMQQFPVGLWWRNGDQVPYPTAIQGKNRSDSWSAEPLPTYSARP